MRYSKTALNFDQQAEQLKARGLVISDKLIAITYLQNNSYYRLAGYWWPMQADKAKRLFKPGSTFENVIAIYNFDRELRLLVFDAIERVEIAFRTKLIYYLSHRISPWWFEYSSNFRNAVEHTETLHAIDRELNLTKEVFIKKHHKRYVYLSCMKYLLNSINHGNDFTKRLYDLLLKCPSIDPNALGMKPNWQNEPLWHN